MTLQALAGFCGDYCGKCPNYPGTCTGCHPADHPDCHFIRCCLSRGIEHCGLCTVFPCSRLVSFVPDDSPGCPPGYHIANLRERAAKGTPRWIEIQRARWGR